SVDAFAAKLLSIGLKKGDVVATSLPLLKEHIYLLYACFRTGIIAAPLDLRLKAKEVRYCIDRIRPKAVFFAGAPQLRPVFREVVGSAPSVRTWVQFQKEADGILPGAVWVTDFVRDIKAQYLKSAVFGTVRRARRAVGKRDPCLIIFTTGSTGSPKPALLCHENILVQNIGLAAAFEFRGADRMLVNLPPSHVGCLTEQLSTTVYAGGISVILHIFDPAKSLEAIQKHRVTVLGQIPALFNMEWRLSKYGSFDLSSLRFAIYGGQAVSRQFLEKLKAMAPTIGTGLGLTETAGFCTYTDIDAGVDDLALGIGFDMPLAPLSVRGPMTPGGGAGDPLGTGELGEVCFSGPQVFLGYLGDPENTAKTISTDGVCYTGDLGSYDKNGLHFAGRAKLVIKPKGYQVFPEDVENHIMQKLRGMVSAAACLGAEHEVYSEAIIVFVECAEGHAVTPSDVIEATRDLSSYSRPSHVEVLESGRMPLNRVAKTDYVALKARAADVVAALRAAGKWDK
ncbi:MAG: acyl--CoA ligase, partial [Deltaproteobacteria bacterium]|nr:acyl--CoA ligase [Deltaproteobacteria bacterium]